MMRLAALAAMALALNGCDSDACIDTAANCQASRTFKSKDVMYVSHDRENAVTCWSKSNSTLYCMPDWMIQRPEVKP